MKTTSATALLLTSTTAAVSGFTVVPSHNSHNAMRSTTHLNGLFDGVKEAFSAPPSQLNSERETPIDRWMGWSVVSENVPANAVVAAAGTTREGFACRRTFRIDGLSCFDVDNSQSSLFFL
jgi:hypothetical protein